MGPWHGWREWYADRPEFVTENDDVYPDEYVEQYGTGNVSANDEKDDWSSITYKRTGGTKPGERRKDNGGGYSITQ